MGCDDVDAVVQLSVDYLAMTLRRTRDERPDRLPVTVRAPPRAVGIGESRPRLSWVTRTDLPDWRQAAYELEIEPEDGDVVVVGPRRLGGVGARAVGGAGAGQPRAPDRPRARVGRGRRRAVGVERGRRRRGRAAGAGGLVGRAGPAACCRPSTRSRCSCCAASSCSTSPSPAPGSTPPRRASTRPSSTAPSSATTCWRRAGPRYEHRLRYQTFDVTDLLAEGRTPSASRSPTAGTAATSASPARRRSTATGSARSCSSRSSTPTAAARRWPATAPGARPSAR